MSTNREYAPAKLTRTLRVIGRRSDGYHLLDAEMISLDLCDELEFEEAPSSSLTVIDEIAWSGPAAASGQVAPESPPVPADGTNLVLRALSLAGVQAKVTLRKRIPAGAGLGGGSADAAAALRHAGRFDVALAERLGADVPFCLWGGRARVTGVGELLEALPPVERTYVILTPGFGVSTVAAYAAFDELGPGDGPNDLERAAIAVEPRLELVRDLITDVAGERPVLAGSGSSFFVECRVDAAATLRSELVDASRTEGVIASVVGCTSIGPSWSGPPAT